MVVGEHAAHLDTADLHETDVRTKVAADITQVRGPAFCSVDVAYEVASIGGDVEHRRPRINKALQVAADLGPDEILHGSVPSAEAGLVEAIEIAARRLNLRPVTQVRRHARSRHLGFRRCVAA